MGHLAAGHPAGGFCAPAAASGVGNHDGGQPDSPLCLARTASRRSYHFAAPARGLELAGVMLTALRYYWITAKGYRLRPWASPYIRWRLETFFGGDMHALGA